MSSRRRLVSVLAPRPLELIVKSPLLVGAFLVGTWSPLLDVGVSWRDFILAVVAFEFFFYQGRYMLNDILERDLDRDHPAAEGRGRLAGLDGVDSRLLATVALVRIGLGVAVTGLMARRFGALVLAAMAAAGGAAFVYEYLRRRVRSQPQPLVGLDRPLLVHHFVYGAVGLGYVIRITLGITLAGGEEGGLMVPAVVFGWAFGLMFVTMTWALEASSLISNGWSAEIAGRKSHVAVLATYASGSPRFDASARVLLGVAPFFAPWAWSTVLASSVAGWLGWILVGSTNIMAQSLLAAGAAVFGYTVGRLGNGWAMSACGLGGAFFIFAIALSADLARPWLAAVPYAVVLGTHIAFRHLRAVDIGLAPEVDTPAAT